MTGPGVFAVESRATIQRDSWRLSVIAITVVTILLFLIYRSVTPLLLSLLPVLTGLLVGWQLQTWFGFVHGITLGFRRHTDWKRSTTPPTSWGIAEERLQQTLSRIWPTLKLAVPDHGLRRSACCFRVSPAWRSWAYWHSWGSRSRIRDALDPSRPAAGVIRSAPHQLLPVTWLAARSGIGESHSLDHMGGGPAGPAHLAVRHEDIWDNDLANLSPIASPSKTSMSNCERPRRAGCPVCADRRRLEQGRGPATQ